MTDTSARVNPADIHTKACVARRGGGQTSSSGEVVHRDDMYVGAGQLLLLVSNGLGQCTLADCRRDGANMKKENTEEKNENTEEKSLSKSGNIASNA